MNDDEPREEETTEGAGAETEGGGEEEEERAHIGHSPADSSTSDEPEAAGDEDVEYVELAKIHNAPTRAGAKIVKGILESADIPCVIEDDSSDMFDGYVGSQLDGIDVFVPTVYEGKATALLAQHGLAARVDPQLVENFAREKLDPAVGAGDAACGEVAGALAQEARDFRQAVLLKLEPRGRAGLDCVRAILKAALRQEENPLIGDIPRLVEAGHFGKDAALTVVNDLSTVAGDADPAVRRRVAAALGRVRGAGASATLVNLLSDKDAGVRDEALESLYSLSNGETFDFDPDRDPAEQEEAIVRWREWLRDNPAT